MKRSLLNKDLQSQAEFIVENKVIIWIATIISYLFVSYKNSASDFSQSGVKFIFHQLISKNQQDVYYAIPE